MRTNLKKILSITFLFYSIFSVSYAQHKTIDELKNKIAASDNKYFKVLSSIHEEGQLIESDTLEYVTRENYVYFKSKNTECLTQEHSLLIDHENRMIALALFRKQNAIDDLDMLSSVDTTSTNWKYDEKNNHLYYSLEEGKDKISFDIYFNQNNTIKKTIYTTYIDGIEKTQTLLYLIFCLDTTCFPNKNFPQLQEIVEQKRKKEWILNQYKGYSLSVY